MSLDNHFSEIAILSILLKNPSLFETIGGLDYTMLSSSPNKALLSEMQELYKNNTLPEANLVLSSLSNKGILPSAGGQPYIEYLLNQNFAEENLGQFLNHVIQSHKARVLMVLSSKIPDMVADVSDIDTAISSIEESLRGIKIGVSDSVLSLDNIAKEVWNDIIQRVSNPNKITNTTGFTNIDAATAGYYGGDLWIVAGRPGMGKSAMMCNSILSGVPSLVFSLEMSRVALVHRLLAIKSGVPVFDIRLGSLNQKQLDVVAHTLEEIKSLPIYFDSTFNVTPSYIYSTIRKYKKLYNIQVAHLDYIQILVERSNVAVHELGQVSREMKAIANDLNMTIVVYAQLNRLVEGRPDKRPMLSDIRQSGNLEEDADLVMFLYRDVKYNSGTKKPNSIEFIISKHRNGPTGTLYGAFDEVTNRITQEK